MKITCHDVGEKKCHFVAVGRNSIDVKEKILSHTKSRHRDKLSRMSIAEIGKMNRIMDYLISRQS